MKHVIIFCCFLFALTGCSSSPVTINYYVLGSPVSAGYSVSADKPAVVLEHLELAAYLRQSGLVMQPGQNKMHISKSHLWAESLDDALPKALQKELQRQSKDFGFYLKAHDWVQDTDFRLRLRIDGFHPNSSGEVLGFGRYQIIPIHIEAPSLLKDFHFKLELEEDGYTHAVSQLDRLIERIAGDIVDSMAINFSANDL